MAIAGESGPASLSKASRKSHSCRGRASARFFFAVFAFFALPQARQKTQKLQKIFPVAAGDRAHKRLLRSLAALIGLRENSYFKLPL